MDSLSCLFPSSFEKFILGPAFELQRGLRKLDSAFATGNVPLVVAPNHLNGTTMSRDEVRGSDCNESASVVPVSQEEGIYTGYLNALSITQQTPHAFCVGLRGSRREFLRCWGSRRLRDVFSRGGDLSCTCRVKVCCADETG
ncbi:hypothetical protein C8035_v009141 [Colletotrichum spinosum]|uniref:Uncharacterized protein n=1 Tax=Colletotrichum spinosum TaxID=1347390 RepID=A0A4R8PS79_9PEZI|nr:hypothetical protein C8035_v009141 [Colletotrichum spinosum]